MKIYKNDVFQFFNFDTNLSDQGWKIHIFSTFENSEEILKKCKEIANIFRVNFKYIYDSNVLKHFMCKETDYKFAGKYITFYLNNDENKLKIVIEELYKNLHEYKPFKILGDKNYKNSIINYRFGNYDPNRDYIVSQDGKKIKDKRQEYIPKNSGIEDPFLNHYQNKDKSELPTQIILNDKYIILKTLFFSNLGGVFLSLNKENNKKYILKEHRFYNYDKDSQRSNEIRFSFSNRPFFIEKFFINNSIFFVFEYIHGKPLHELNNKNMNLILKIIVKLCFLVSEFHKENIVMNDIKLENFVWNGKKLYFIDKEFCYYFGEKGAKIKNKFLGLDDYKFDPFYIDRLKLAEVILGLFNIKKEVFFIENNYEKYLNYVKVIFTENKVPKNVFVLLKKLILNKENSIPTFSSEKLTFFEKFEETINHNQYFFKKKIKENIIFNPALEKNFVNADLYIFIFEKIINKNISVEILDNWLKSTLDEENYEDNLKLILLWKYKKININAEEKIYEIIKKFVVKIKNEFYVRDKGFLIPYIQKGIGSLCLVIIEILEENKNYKKTKIFHYLTRFYNGLILFPIWSVKTTFLFGCSGIAFLVYYIGNFLKLNNKEEISKKILFNLFFMQKKLKWQTQENIKLDETFFNGNKGIKWVLKLILTDEKL